MLVQEWLIKLSIYLNIQHHLRCKDKAEKSCDALIAYVKIQKKPFNFEALQHTRAVKSPPK